MPRIIEGASGPAVRVGERPRGYKRGGITSTTWETARELMLRLVECPPARPIFEKASYALVQDGEGVLNQAATDALGGPEAVNEINQTQSLGGRSQEVILQVGQRELGRATVAEMGAGRELDRAIEQRTGRRAGVRPVYNNR